jgi:hypothetical protein
MKASNSKGVFDQKRLLLKWITLSESSKQKGLNYVKKMN